MKLLRSFCYSFCFFFFFQAEDGIRDVAVTGVQTCALPILRACRRVRAGDRGGQAARRGVSARAWPLPEALHRRGRDTGVPGARFPSPLPLRSEEHTSELQSRLHLVCRLLLEKKKTTNNSSKNDLA